MDQDDAMFSALREVSVDVVGRVVVVVVPVDSMLHLPNILQIFSSV